MDNMTKYQYHIISIFKALLIAYIITGVLLLALTGLLFKMDFNEGQVRVGIILIYILSVCIGGFIIGKSMKSRKFIWGLVVGASYFIILTVISLAVNRSLHAEPRELLTTLMMCCCGGMFGGMIS